MGGQAEVVWHWRISIEARRDGNYEVESKPKFNIKFKLNLPAHWRMSYIKMHSWNSKFCKEFFTCSAPPASDRLMLFGRSQRSLEVCGQQ